ncbi:hypothetical protein EVG20_g5881 [Dentipellis fragilis]|uniref:cyclin-dependent kinase n=1 Tax=Dentipellis fragilis TaxID=205917 RepID=A0A4Y9YR59_9AGAM|nr:hypothetical protein EVG20_g5881 [Dentipellis fragilis]
MVDVDRIWPLFALNRVRVSRERNTAKGRELVTQRQGCCDELQLLEANGVGSIELAVARTTYICVGIDVTFRSVHSRFAYIFRRRSGSMLIHNLDAFLVLRTDNRHYSPIPKVYNDGDQRTSKGATEAPFEASTACGDTPEILNDNDDARLRQKVEAAAEAGKKRWSEKKFVKEPLEAARSHGKEPSHGAKQDSQIRQEELDYLKGKGKATIKNAAWRSERFEDATVIAETLVSVVYRQRVHMSDGSHQWTAVKTGEADKHLTKEPHDIIKELRILLSLSHPNIINVLHHAFDQGRSLQSFWMPYIPHSLTALLASPRFSAQPYGADPQEAKDGPSDAFRVISKALVYQLLGAIAYLHEEGREIAHRDIKPSNILFCDNGCLKLIDFGIVFKVDESDADKKHNLWPEDSRKMYFEVGTGPYRAPELLFGPKSYDALAADRWALGATLAEFFTSLHGRNVNDDDDDWDSDDEQEDRTKAYIVGSPKSAWASVKWERCSLFDSSRGDLGLIWSIFSTRGTPNAETWPSFKDLPDATKVTFTEAEGVDLASLLPNMPLEHRRSETLSIAHCPPPDPTPSPLDLIHRFLVYPQASRLKARDALMHPWFQSEPPVLLLPETESAATSSALTSKSWNGKSLGDWLRVVMATREDHEETG